MELKDFISATLTQIVEGVRIAQDGELGGNVNAAMDGAQFGGNLVNFGSLGVATRVDFDVSITAETKGSGDAKISIVGVFSAGGGGSHNTGATNKISFSVPVRLPDGDPERQERIRAEVLDRHAKRINDLSNHSASLNR